MDTSALVWIILAPLFDAILNDSLYFYHIKKSKISENYFALIGTITPLISFLITLSLFLRMLEERIIFKQRIFIWLNVDKLNIEMTFLGDNLSIFMSMFITFVGWLIHIYAIGYMKGDDGFGKFFAYFNLFLASMLILVLADNPIILLIGWESVGVCSYLLIKFYYGSKDNVIAANEVSIVNRVGDFGFLFGVVTLFFVLGQVNLSFGTIEANIGNTTNSLLILSGFLLFIEAMGKSAQIPLYVWLPDAMAGPIPISALIHAATMVAAGVYMTVRFHFSYAGIEEIGIFIVYVGAISTLLAAVIATKQTDVEKILAYSTISQLGYMFITVGLDLYSTGLFRVFTHAFFKAMLFMGAGGIIITFHHEQNILKIAKHRANLPIIGLTFLVGVIAISGIPPFSGFFSKDTILATTLQEGQYLICGIALFTAFLTVHYMFRTYFIVFAAPNHHDVDYVYTLKTITLPLLILVIGAVGTGFLNLPSIFGGNHFVDTWLGQLSSKVIHLNHSTEYILMMLSVAIAACGIFVAYKKYANSGLSKEETGTGFVDRRLYIDELYSFLFVKSAKAISTLIDKVLDDKIIDVFIMKSSTSFVNVGKKVAMIQNANVRFYVAFMLIGMTCIFVYLYVALGL